VGEEDQLKKDLNKTEMDLQGLLGANAHEIEAIDKLIEKKRQEAGDAERKLKAAKPGTETTAAKAVLKTANDDLDKAKESKKNFRTGKAYTDSTGTPKAAIGGNIDALEKQQKDQAQAIKSKNVQRNQQYAASQQTGWERTKSFLLTGDVYSKAASEEAAHSIIMETKLDSGEKPH